MDRNTKEAIVQGSKFVSRALLATLALGGIVITGAVAPNLFRAIEGILRFRDIKWIDDNQRRSRRMLNTFKYLLDKGYIKKKYRGKQLYISLTDEGRKKARQFSIDTLTIARVKRWDKKWRMVLFDVEEKRKLTREALRGKLKELGFYQLQKSVWVHAFPCERELHKLEDFFELDDSQYMCFEITGLPKSHEKLAKKHFELDS